ncbi:glycosyl hydrolase family 2 [Chitinophaga alhagiae]|uniref:Glycosyl hydrolase family 2 n=1 Tax=Chitinophaga alhagiae TaxID=2203219 RepID=A0ABM6W9M2_9BACT|nr:glycoside hydrolase family 2 TIM barrel-domain containing protein [Chitinophaga alhagiae]AWO00586.1 glycosyl hydrolase family 2 [Chitinophaga alhagiae]
MNVFRKLALLPMALLFSCHLYANGVPQRITAFTTLSTVKLEAVFDGMPAAGAQYRITITDSLTGKTIFDKTLAPTAVLAEEKKLVFHTGPVNAQAWAPSAPYLYHLSFTVSGQGRQAQTLHRRIGFRFFESRNGQLWLNGKPVFLRGIAINPPARGIPDTIEKSRRFAEEYVRYMKSLHVNIIRIPNNETWYDVCDELGMMVFGGNYSSSVMGEKPPTAYDEAVSWYKNEAYANIAGHPSLMIYAMTNEVPYDGEIGERWEKFLTYAHTALRRWDSTRLYIGNPGYGYGKSGDICDLHRYWGWYYCSPFNFINIRNNAAIVPFPKKAQPVTFTECVGNYTGPDGKYNLTPDHKNPGSQLNWTGHAPWSEQARLADEHQSFTFKKATELFRRLRVINPELSGVFPFTILFYNWNNVQQFVDMGPKPVTRQARLSYQPLLVSWENWATQVYAGATIHPVVHVVNDDDRFEDLRNARLVYQLRSNGHITQLGDTLQLPSIAYYSTWQKKLSITLPATLPSGQYELVGKILKGDKVVSENYDALYIGIRSAAPAAPSVYLYDPSGNTAAAFNRNGIPYKLLATLQQLPAGATLVLGENSARTQMGNLRSFVQAGGRVLCLRQDSAHMPVLNSLLPVPIKNITTALDVPAYPPPPRPSRNGLYLNPERPEHPVFDGITRERLRVWSDYTGWNESQPGFPAVYPVTDGFVPVHKKDLEHIAVLGNYGMALEGMALAEFFDGKGSVLLCGLDLAARAGIDPVADRMLCNLAGYMAGTQGHHRYPLITAPIVWGDYATEKGVLTGVNSGLMVHAVPRAPANIKSTVRLTREGNRFQGAAGGFNTRPGVQYVANGRRMYGPYYLRGFGNVPEPVDTTGNIGEGVFWCRVPADRKTVATLVWNQADEPLPVTVQVNGQAPVRKEIAAGASIWVDCPLNATTVKMRYSGDRRLVLLETTFR